MRNRRPERQETPRVHIPLISKSFLSSPLWKINSETDCFSPASLALSRLSHHRISFGWLHQLLTRPLAASTLAPEGLHPAARGTLLKPKSDHVLPFSQPHSVPMSLKRQAKGLKWPSRPWTIRPLLLPEPIATIIPSLLGFSHTIFLTIPRRPQLCTCLKAFALGNPSAFPQILAVPVPSLHSGLWSDVTSSRSFPWPQVLILPSFMFLSNPFSLVYFSFCHLSPSDTFMCCLSLPIKL